MSEFDQEQRIRELFEQQRKDLQGMHARVVEMFALKLDESHRQTADIDTRQTEREKEYDERARIEARNKLEHLELQRREVAAFERIAEALAKK